MTTFVDSLKKEIARVARRELKAELGALRKSSSTHRSDIAALKRELKASRAKIAQLEKQVARSRPDAAQSAAPSSAPRSRRPFSGQTLLEHRKHLGITQEQMGQLLQASSLSVWKWESGKVQPRAGALARINALLKMGKRAALARLKD